MKELVAYIKSLKPKKPVAWILALHSFLNLTEDTVTISGEKKQEEKVEKKDYYRLERSYGTFTRSFRLPKEVQTDKAKATFKDGVLEVKVPKTEEAKKKEKKVPVE